MGARETVRARLLFLLSLLMAAACAQAALTNAFTPTAAFEQANRLYEQGRFQEATAAYEQLVATGHTTAAVWFNLGNAAYKAGQIGRAIAAYRLLERQEPRDAFLRANLQFVRGKVYADEKSRVPLWKGLVRRATLNEWTMLASAWLWMFFAVLACGEWTGRRYWKSAAGLFLGFTISATALAGAVLDLRTPEAVVVVREATVRFGPLDESQAAFQLRDGAELTVLSTKDQWMEVLDAEKRAGWIRRDALAVLPAWPPVAPR